jgi:universal stress protein A
MRAHFSTQLTVVRAYTNPDWLQEVQDGELRQLQKFVAEAFPSQQVDTFLEVSEPAAAIEKIARKQEADLVMIATRSSDPTRLVYGVEKRSESSLFESELAKVLQHLSAAIWNCPDQVQGGYPREISYKSLLCAVDFGEDTEAVLRSAVALASSYQARLSLLHVVDTSDPSVIRQTDDHLGAVKNRLGISAPHKILSGSLPETVRDEAVREKSDLIVVGRGLSQGALTRLLSQLYPIIHEAPCPVLSI